MKYKTLTPSGVLEKLREYCGNMHSLIAENTPKPEIVEYDFVSLVDKYSMGRHDAALSDVIFIGLKYDDEYIIPEYQRALVWTAKQKQDLIVSVLIDNPIGDFIFKETKFNGGSTFYYTVIDGQQRINTLREFVTNQFPMEDGRYFSDLKYWDQRRVFERRVMYYTVPNASLEDEIDIYLGRNKGGTAHTAEELEKASKMLKNKQK